jgi:transcriptional antiterminator NusG
MEDIGKGGKWYALFVVTGKEEKVRERILSKLKDKSIQVIIPQRHIRLKKKGIWEYRTRKLLPGYILLNSNMGVKEYYSLQDLPGLLEGLKDGCKLYEMDEQETGVILTLIRYGETIGSSYIELSETDGVIVIDGPLLGLEGLIESVNKRNGRARVRLNFLGETRIIELGVSILQPI